MTTGVLANYPVDNMKIRVFDGSFHAVDSDSMSFELCAKQGFREAARKAKPVLLEPIMRVEVITPAQQDENGNITFPAVIADGTEIKTPAKLEKQNVVDKPEWLASNGWFMSIARTPITAPTGIMDGIEYTLQNLPIDVPNGYVLQQP